MWRKIKVYFWPILCVILIFIIIILSHLVSPRRDVGCVSKQDATKVEKVEKALKVSPVEAGEIIHYIPKAQKVESYTAPSVRDVAKHEEKVKQSDKKIDKVLVVDKTNEPEHKVDVYRITLKKEHKVKAGITVEDGRAYPAIGYQAGRFEGVATIDGSHVKSATVMYTVTEW